MSNFDETLMKRLTKLEREVERLKVKERPVGGGGGVTDHGALTGLADNDHPQYRLVADAIDHGALGGLADNDHPQYLLTTGKAADSDKLDGVDSTGFATAGHNHSGVYLPIAGKAADSDKLDGIDSTGFSLVDHSHNTFSTAKFVPLSTPLTSTSWDGDARSTTAKTKIDLSAVFGVPDGAKGIFVRLVARDSGSSAGYCQLSLSPNNTASSVALQAHLQGVADDVYVSVNGVVPCDENGDVYYQITASGTGTLDAIIEIWGYWIDQTGLPTGLYEDAQVSAYRDNTAFSFTTSGTIYAVPLNQESYDTHSFHSTTTNPERFTCTKAGTYLITGQVSFAANATGNRDALVRVNGTDYVGQMRLQAASSGSTSVPVTAIVKLNVGDYVELCGRQYSGGSLGTYYANTISNYMTMVLITESPVDAWQNWTPTVTGWAAGYVVNTARYKLIGKTCFFSVDISGTSNSTAVTATMPFTSYSGAGDPVWGGTNAYVQNNGTVATTSASRWYISENSATLIAHTNMSTGTWTASGAKRIRVMGFYEIA